MALNLVLNRLKHLKQFPFQIPNFRCFCISLLFRFVKTLQLTDSLKGHRKTLKKDILTRGRFEWKAYFKHQLINKLLSIK